MPTTNAWSDLKTTYDTILWNHPGIDKSNLNETLNQYIDAQNINRKDENPSEDSINNVISKLNKAFNDED